MKEATGELSTTVIAIVAIAAIIAIFTAFLLPTLRSQIALTQACNNGPDYKTTASGSDKGFITCGQVATSPKAPTCTSGTNKAQKTCNSENTAGKYICVYCETK